MKNKFVYGLLIIVSFLLATENKVFADTVTANNEQELVALVNNATEDRTILLSSMFPKNITRNIQLKETEYNITIDGQNQTVTSNEGYASLITF